MRKNSTIMLLLFVILIIGCSCESRVPMYQVTEEKKNNEMMELMEEYGTNITIDHIIEEYYSNEPEAEFDDKYIIGIIHIQMKRRLINLIHSCLLN
jgi:alcohol dehydrogenase YqhD (iron-dependent ADH family)